MINKIKQWISIKRSQNARLLLLLAIVGFNVLIWLISSLLAYIIDPSLYGSVVESLWNSGITWMLEPGFYDPSVSVPIRIISIVVIITSMITFSGGIIAYVANLFASIIEHSRQGKNALFISNHILILNWNSKALELIADYRFDDQVTNIVVLSDQDKEHIEQAIRNKLYEINHRSKLKNMNIIVREGDVYSKHDLDKVCLERAKTIVILAAEEASSINELKNPDILSIKSLMLIAHANLRPEQSVIVEIINEETLPLIKEKISNHLSLENQIIPILPDEMLGRLIAQTILYPVLNSVFQELFSFEGMEFYAVENKEFETIYEQCPRVIPLFKRNDHLYVIAGNEKDVQIRRDKPAPKPLSLAINVDMAYPETTIVVFGTNNKLKYILDSLHWFEKDASTKVNVTLVPANDMPTIRKHTQDLAKIDTILVLSDDHLEPKDYDSDVLVTLLMIQEIAIKHNAKIVIELLNPRNFDIAKSYNIENTIISNQYISRIITQLTKNRDLYPLFMELLTYDAENSSYEIYTFPAGSFIDGNYPMSFNSASEFIRSVYTNSDQQFMPIGILDNQRLRIFSGNLDEPQELVLEKDTLVAIVCK
ncbi:MAG: hypothetical protein JXR38_02740 [Bacilli bacterium]|nr:hypothetical protein [Bacilli bacterium]